MEKYKQKQDGKYDSHALKTLEILKRRLKDSHDLFSAEDQKKYEQYKTMFAQEYEILENDEVFQNLSPEQQRQVANKYLDERMNNIAGRN